MFNTIDTAGSGMNVMTTWIDALANNIANVNDTTPTSQAAFQATYVQAQAKSTGANGVGGGVEVAALPQGSAAGVLTYSPQDPNANAQGYVRRPDIDLASQMTDLIMAQRAYQANSTVIDRATDVYKAAIAINKGN